MTKMIISSFYNTIIDKEEAIPVSTMLEIERIRKNNIKFVLLTNRSAIELLEYNRDFPFIDYIIAFNGNYVYDVENNKCLLDVRLKQEDIEYIKNEFKDKKMLFYSIDNNYFDDECLDLYKIEVKLSPKDLKNIKLLNNDNLKSSLFRHNKETFLEITSAKSNNCNALNLLMKLEEIDKSDVTAILGNNSEIDLLKCIKDAYVVSNAKEIKKLATNKTKSNNSKGVENVIKKII